MMKIQALEQEAFAEFGEILSMDDVPSVDSANEFAFHDTAQGIRLASHCCTGVLSCRNRPRKVVKMERHHESSEVIVALDGDVVMVMAPSDDELENNTRVRSFLIKQGQAIVMKPNTWHWIPFPVDKQDVHALVLFKDATGANDLHFRDLTVPIVLD